MSIGSRYWNARFSTWGAARPQEQGYSLLVPVPGDLPVFLELALSVLRLQDHEHRVETIVVPDRPTPQMDAVIARHRGTWDGPLEKALFPQPERRLLPALSNPFHNYGIQLITGTRAAKGSHVLLHDADLFLLSPGSLDRHYEAARADDLVACGVSPVWDSWFTEHGFQLAATWELCAQRDWLRSFPPAMHMGHTAELLGEEHVFDITLHSQALTDPRRIGIRPQDEDIVHFNHVIGTYRGFQRAKGTFADDQFRLLLIRLFIDLFAQVEADYALPTFDELARGLTDPSAPVTYPVATAEVTREYRGFRDRIERILTGAWAPDGRGEDATRALAAFDRHYAAQVPGQDVPADTTRLGRPRPGQASRGTPMASSRTRSL